MGNYKGLALASIIGIMLTMAANAQQQTASDAPPGLTAESLYVTRDLEPIPQIIKRETPAGWNDLSSLPDQYQSFMESVRSFSLEEADIFWKPDDNNGITLYVLPSLKFTAYKDTEQWLQLSPEKMAINSERAARRKETSEIFIRLQDLGDDRIGFGLSGPNNIREFNLVPWNFVHSTDLSAKSSIGTGVWDNKLGFMISGQLKVEGMSLFAIETQTLSQKADSISFVAESKERSDGKLDLKYAIILDGYEEHNPSRPTGYPTTGIEDGLFNISFEGVDRETAKPLIRRIFFFNIDSKDLADTTKSIESIKVAGSAKDSVYVIKEFFDDTGTEFIRTPVTEVFPRLDELKSPKTNFSIELKGLADEEIEFDFLAEYEIEQRQISPDNPWPILVVPAYFGIQMDTSKAIKADDFWKSFIEGDEEADTAIDGVLAAIIDSSMKSKAEWDIENVVLSGKGWNHKGSGYVTFDPANLGYGYFAKMEFEGDGLVNLVSSWSTVQNPVEPYKIFGFLAGSLGRNTANESMEITFTDRAGLQVNKVSANGLLQDLGLGWVIGLEEEVTFDKSFENKGTR